ncbi:PREDICTED: uncharacterized protein LOC104727212 [Camelina sativa]|uniref:Uncharacterized protein LOC104727212 n=1 Tax=Camelina sativa TaxID=90675 RepID=A0ABM0UQR5_CAMSA|nr:PREDICTED: uncharacterized protein LOC104727212 [Camelina sativa]XP_010444666.1 PREDICTED: uncharacterized protein LOC104727212 [Camelina sativa]
MRWYLQGGRFLPKCPETGPRVPPKTTTRNWRPVQLVARDPFGRPRPRPFIMDLIEAMKRVHPDEMVRYGYIFSQLLRLPKPPLPEIDTRDKFAVKLVEFDPEKRNQVVGAVARAKIHNVKVLKSLSDVIGVQRSLFCVQNVPNSLIRQGVTKEEATEIITSIEAAGGVAVMEPVQVILMMSSFPNCLSS